MLSVNQIDQIIRASANWPDLKSEIDGRNLSTEKGDIFERFVQLFLKSSPIYRQSLKNVWSLKWDKLPDQIETLLSLPNRDEGIDLICETQTAELWSVQCKFESNPHAGKSITRKELSTFTSLSFVHCKDKIKFGLVAHSSVNSIKKSEIMGPISEIGLAEWEGLTSGEWEAIQKLASGTINVSFMPKKPRPFQVEALNEIHEQITAEGVSRGKVLMPCGTGKSLLAYWLSHQLEAKNILVTVPSLSLLKQTLQTWAAEDLGAGLAIDWIVVCSDETVKSHDNSDAVTATVAELGLPVTTDPNLIEKFLVTPSNKRKVAFVTYQSSEKFCEVARKCDANFDLLIADEAHRTTGKKGNNFSHVLFDENICIKKRVFFTATERVYRGENRTVASMDDPETYGKNLFYMSFKKAIELGVICDYRITTVGVKKREIRKFFQQNKLHTIVGHDNFDAFSRDIGTCIAIGKLARKVHLKKIVTFHRSIKLAEENYRIISALKEKLFDKSEFSFFHVSGKISVGKRAKTIKEFSESKAAVITNARCLTEGIDVPAIDCVTFFDRKNSVVDVVQSVGRALRNSPETGKVISHVLVPVVLDDDADLQDLPSSDEFKRVLEVVTHLSTQDERIADYFRAPSALKGGGGLGPPITWVDLPEMLLSDVLASVEAKIWSVVGKANWRPFEDARAYVRSLKLQNVKEWNNWFQSDARPPDIPAAPQVVYANAGWHGFGDWLGTGGVANFLKVFRPFFEAREFARGLQLQNAGQWRAWCRSGERPDDIPNSPNVYYADKGWISWGDWLGTTNVANKLKTYREFNAARAFARSLQLSGENAWRAWSKTDARPVDIPTNPQRTYRAEGWIDWTDWLGSGVNLKNVVYRPFIEARDFVQKLNLKNAAEWRLWCKSGARPIDIPTNPEKTYRSLGWISYGDWLGSGTIAPQKMTPLPFTEARAFVRSLGLRNQAEWNAWCKSGKRPPNIPTNPHRTYKDEGWRSMPDWLGN